MNLAANLSFRRTNSRFGFFDVRCIITVIVSKNAVVGEMLPLLSSGSRVANGDQLVSEKYDVLLLYLMSVPVSSCLDHSAPGEFVPTH